jgi:hypothetical protein
MNESVGRGKRSRLLTSTVCLAKPTTPSPDEDNDDDGGGGGGGSNSFFAGGSGVLLLGGIGLMANQVQYIIYRMRPVCVGKIFRIFLK